VRKPWFARILSPVLFLLVWQFVTPLLPTELIPMPSRVLEFMWEEIRGITVARTNVWQAFGISLRRLGLGFLIAFAIGLPIGVLTGVSKWVDRMLRDFILVGLAMPSLVWALLFGLWFGLDSAAPILTVLLAAVPFVIINTQEGVRDVPRDLNDMARAFQVSRSHVVRHVTLPSLMPFFFAALRYGLANGWKGLVLAEVFAATSGAGWNIQFWRDAHRAQGVVGYALFFILFALFVERVIFQRISGRVFRWRPSDTQVGLNPPQFQEPGGAV
jgi:NitT/TauT family transport system permease protein